MTFLSPTPALIAAAVCIPALLVLYLLKLRRRPIRISSTVLWQQAVRDTQVNVPFRWLRPTWLFLLQFLVLSLFLLAMARPALDMAGAESDRVVLLIDRSASMSARDAGPVSDPASQTRLEAAKARALRLIDQLSRAPTQPRIAVVAVAAEPRLLAPLGSPAAARAAIDAIEPTDQPGDLAAALQLAGALLTTETAETEQRNDGAAVLFSDGAFPEAQQRTLRGAQFRYERIGPPPSTDAHDNLGIVALSARRDDADPAVVRIFLRVANASDEPIASPLVLTLDGREIERRSVTAPARGETSLSLQLTTRDGGIVEIALVREDALPADNRAALILPAATKPRLLLVIPDPPAHPTSPEELPAASTGQEWILTRLLDEMQLPWRLSTASTYELDAASPEGLRAELVIFDRVQPVRLPPIPSISFGAGLPVPGLETATITPEHPRGSYFIAWQRTHPILRDVALDTVYVSRPLSLPDALPAGSRGRFADLARGPGGPLIAELERDGFRRVLVGFALADSMWPLQVGFPIFMAASTDYLTLRAQASEGRFFTTAEPAWVAPPPGLRRLVLDGPTRIAAEAPPSSAAAPAVQPRLSLGMIERSGVYRDAAQPATQPLSAIAVNLLDPLESSLAVADAVRVSGESVRGDEGATGPVELWPWLMVAALVLLSIEWFLNAWLQRV